MTGEVLLIINFLIRVILSGNIVIRSYSEGDEEEIIQVLNGAFHGWPRIDLECTPKDHWRWKYLVSPIQSHVVAVATSEGRVVGVNQQYAVKVKVGEEIILGNYAGDLAVDVEFRGRGRSKDLIEFSGQLREKQDIHLVYFVTRNPYLIKSYSSHYPEFPFEVAALARIVDIDEHLNMIPMKNSLLIKTGYLAVKTINQILVKDSHTGLRNGQVSEIDQFGEEFDEFWCSIQHDYRFILERKSSYLNWRYCDERAGNFRVTRYDEDGVLTGYCVTRINRFREDYPIGYVVDLMTLKDRAEVADILVLEALSHFDENNVNLVLAACIRKHRYQRLFRRHGFVNPGINFKLYHLSALKEVSIENDYDKVHFMFGDIDSLPTELELS